MKELNNITQKISLILQQTMTYTYIKGPQDKHDLQTIAYLDTLPIEHWKHLIWDLLDWLGDSNWPIFSVTADLLLKNPRGCLDDLRRIFVGDDDELQFNILCTLIPRMPEDCIRALAPDLRRFQQGVSDEVNENWEMRELVDEVLEGYS
jgi:hypothetical protein